MKTNVKISELPLKTVVKDTDLVIVQDGNVTNVMTVNNLTAKKADIDYVSKVGHSNDYNDLDNKPNVVTTDTTALVNYPLRSEVTGALSLKTDNDDFLLLQNTVAQKANSSDVYTKTECDNKFALKGTTLAEYNISDAYDKTTMDSKLAVMETSINSKAETYYVNTELNKKCSKEYVDTELLKKADLTSLNATNVALTNLQNAENALEVVVTGKFNTPSQMTIAGFGITDAYTKSDVYTKSEVDGKIVGVFHYKGVKATKAELPLTGNTLGDVWNVTENEHNYAWSSNSSSGTIADWDDLGGNADLSNYYTKSETDNELSKKAGSVHSHELGDITSLQSVLLLKADKSDTYTKSEVDTKIAYLDSHKAELTYVNTQLSNKVETTELTTLLAGKADKATTLAGYNISDAYTKADTYTKTEVNSRLATKLEVGMDAPAGTPDGYVLKVVAGKIVFASA